MRLKRIFFWLGVLFIATIFVRTYKISDISMNYSLMDGDIVVVDNFSIGIHIPSYFFYIDKHIWSNEKAIKRGDILVFRHPLDKRLYIKRCVALPNDKIFQENKNFYLQIDSNSTKTFEYANRYELNLVKIDDKWWIKNPYMSIYPVNHDKRVIGPQMLLNYPQMKIPPHSYFFMGDFRDNSTDSRFFGPVPYDYIYYKVRFIIKPARDLETLASTPHYFPNSVGRNFQRY